MRLYIFISKSMEAFCAGFIAESLDEAIELMREESQFNAEYASLGNYEVKVFELAAGYEKGEAFWEAE